MQCRFLLVRSASCPNDFITSNNNCVSTNILITGNTVIDARISEGNLALTTTLIFEPIYMISLSSSAPHSLCSRMCVETWAKNLIIPHINF